MACVCLWTVRLWWFLGVNRREPPAHVHPPERVIHRGDVLEQVHGTMAPEVLVIVAFRVVAVAAVQATICAG